MVQQQAINMSATRLKGLHRSYIIGKQVGLSMPSITRLGEKAGNAISLIQKEYVFNVCRSLPMQVLVKENNSNEGYSTLMQYNLAFPEDVINDNNPTKIVLENCHRLSTVWGMVAFTYEEI